MIPTFAVVGHPNKGKSSIVATLAEDERIIVGPTPGTTRRAHAYTFAIDGEPQYVLVDTPGFQRAKAVFDWLESRSTSASTRSALVAQFVEEHRNDARFHDECELLAPIVAGAGILYVVDGAKPYGPEYELEMQILQWTGRPRMALINMIGAGDYQDEWREGLGQYFSLVRVFDAVHADFETRVGLLRAFGELDETWRPQLDKAVGALETERRRRRERSAQALADLLIDALQATERGALEGEDAALEKRRQEELTRKLQERIRKSERRCRDAVQQIYRHEALARQEQTDALLESDLFTESGWELFGLSHGQLAISGAVAGAVAGGGVDLLLGGASLLLGAGIGALIGGVGAWLGTEELAKVRVLGQALGGRVLQVGPVSAPNFPWVLVGRGWVHHQLVAERNHSYREALSMAIGQDQHLMDGIPDKLRNELTKVFKSVRDGAVDAEVRQSLVGLIDQLLGISPMKAAD